jgi:hypothetical protein
MFAPPSARRNFFKCAPPLTWNPGSAPEHDIIYSNVIMFLLAIVISISVDVISISVDVMGHTSMKKTQ